MSGAELLSGIIGAVETDDRPVDGVAGQLLVALLEERRVGVIHRTHVKPLVFQGGPNQAIRDDELRGTLGVGIQCVEPSWIAGDVLLEPIRGGQIVAIVRRVHLDGGADLFEIVDIHGFGALAFGAVKRREQERGQNADDGDDHEQFDERKRSGRPVSLKVCIPSQFHGRFRNQSIPRSATSSTAPDNRNGLRRGGPACHSCHCALGYCLALRLVPGRVLGRACGRTGLLVLGRHAAHGLE